MEVTRDPINNKSLNFGFTVIEVIVSVAILGMITVAVGRFQKDIFYLSAVARASLSSAQDTRQIVRTMAKEMRAMATANNGSYPLANVATSTVTFYSDTDGDGIREQIRYFVSSSTLKRGSIIPTGSTYSYTGQESVTVLVNDIKNTSSTPMFQYYDTNYTGTSSALSYPIDISKVRLVKINLMVDADVNRSPVQKSYTSQVSIRNLKDNL